MGVIIMGGLHKGRKLSTDTRAQVIRPTSGKVREALFSSLGQRVPGSAFIDLYAGSGAVGFEALSRGAAVVTLVENHPQSFALLKSNCLLLTGIAPRGKRPPEAKRGAPIDNKRIDSRESARDPVDSAFHDPGADPQGRAHLIHADAAAFCKTAAREGRAFDILFADPPFTQDFSALPGLLTALLAPEGIAVIQFPTRTPPSWLEKAGKVKRYGESSLAFFETPARDDAGAGSIF